MTYPIFSKEFKITSPYGWRTHPITGIRTFHNGTDWGTPVGEEQKTPDSGYVRIATTDPYGALYVQVVLDTGYAIEFVHCSKLLVKLGQRVRAGQVVALSGNTGQSTAPHTHFTVFENYKDRRTHTDPVKFLEENYMNLDCKAKLLAEKTKNAFLKSEIAKKDDRITASNIKMAQQKEEIEALKRKIDGAVILLTK